MAAVKAWPGTETLRVWKRVFGQTTLPIVDELPLPYWLGGAVQMCFEVDLERIEQGVARAEQFIAQVVDYKQVNAHQKGRVRMVVRACDCALVPGRL